MINKYLNHGERVIFQLNESIKLDDDEGFIGYLTDYRLIFLKRKGFIFKKDRTVDVFLKDLVGARMVEEGILFKKRHLELRTSNGTIKVYGRGKSVLNFHKKLNEQLMDFKK